MRSVYTRPFIPASRLTFMFVICSVARARGFVLESPHPAPFRRRTKGDRPWMEEAYCILFVMAGWESGRILLHVYNTVQCKQSRRREELKRSAHKGHAISCIQEMEPPSRSTMQQFLRMCPVLTIRYSANGTCDGV